MGPRKLTDEQVEMLIEDGTLNKAELLADQTKEEEKLQKIANTISTIMDVENNVHAVPASTFKKYEELIIMMKFGATIGSNTPEELYLSRTLLMARYENFVTNLLDEVFKCCSCYIYSKYPGYTKYNMNMNNEQPLFTRVKTMLSDLNFMNYFLSEMNTNTVGSYVQGMIEELAYSLHSYTLFSDDPRPDIDVAHIAYSFFNDLAYMIELICHAAEVCLKGIQNFTIDPNIAERVLPPAPFDMSEPINSFYNLEPMHMFDYQDENKPKRKLYTRIPICNSEE